MYKNIEIRKLPSGLLCNLINILEINNDWKKFMSKIPKDLSNREFEPKYNYEHIQMIQEYAKESNQKCTEILFEEWVTSGRVRPTLYDLKVIIDNTQVLYRAADELAVILNESKPQRPTEGPAAPITTDVTGILNDCTDNTNIQRLCNQSTRQMKSADPLIQFSKSNLNSHLSIGNKTTIQMKSDSDLMKFSTDTIQISQTSNQSYSEASESSRNIPDLSAIGYDSSNEANYPNIYQQSFPNIDISIDIDSAILQDTTLKHFEYQELQRITHNFSDTLIEGSNGFVGKIGSGGFGDVFVGTHPNYGILAVKKVHDHLNIKQKPDIAMKVFNAEVKFLSHFRHQNILPIFGFSKDGPVPCIVSEYMEGGSLLDKIAAKVLTVDQRMNIILGTAEGLKYLHTSETPIQSNPELLNMGRDVAPDSQNSTKNFVHGDVKTANILLTKDCVPKLCDFGLAKQYDKTIVTSCPMGTSAYMAPEGLRGTITQKIDIFSFGFVLLELLTGLKPIVVTNGEKINIKDYVEENFKGDINTIIDPVVTNWVKAKEIYTLAQWCLERNRVDRPTMNEVCNTLYELRNNYI